MATIAQLVVDVYANTARLHTDVEKIQTSMDKVGSIAATVGKGLVAAFTVTAIVNAGMEVIDFAGHLTDLAAKTGISTTGLQKLGLVMEQGGVSMDNVAQSSVRLARALIDGDKSTVGALHKMGLQVADLKKLAPEQQFLQVADAVGRIQNPTEKAWAAMQIFGKGGAELLPALNGHLAETAQKFDDMGLIIDQQTVAAADEFGDQLGLLGKQLMGIVATVLGPLLPALSALGSALMWIGSNIIGPVLNVAIKSAMSVLAMFWDVIATVLSGILALGEKIPGVGSKFKAASDWLAGSAKSVEHYMDSLWKSQEKAGNVAAVAAPKMIGLGKAVEGANKHAKDGSVWWFNFAKTIEFFDPLATHIAERIKFIEGGLDALYRPLSDVGEKMTYLAPLTSSWLREFLVPLPAIQTGLQRTRSAAEELGASMMDIVRSMPQMVASALTGGGGLMGAIQAIGSQVGATLGRTVGESISKAVTGLGSLAGPIGAAVGSLLGPLVGGIAGLFKNEAWEATNDMRDAFVDAAGGLDVLNVKAHEVGLTLSRLLDAKTPEAYTAAINELNAAFDRQSRIEGLATSKFGPSQSQLEASVQDASDILDYMQRSGEFTADQIGKAYYAWQKAMADAGNDAAAAWIKTQENVVKSADASTRVMEGLLSQRDALMKSIANEAPEEQMGVIEQQQRAQLSGIEAMIAHQQAKIDAASEATGSTLEGVLDAAAKTGADSLVDAFRDIVLDPIHIRVIPDMDAIPGAEIAGGPAWGGAQADGGSYYVRKPTLFLAGERGPEYADFSGANRGRLLNSVPGAGPVAPRQPVIIQFVKDGRVERQELIHDILADEDGIRRVIKKVAAS